METPRDEWQRNSKKENHLAGEMHLSEVGGGINCQTIQLW
jgi:hypothetical protein